MWFTWRAYRVTAWDNPAIPASPLTGVGGIFARNNPEGCRDRPVVSFWKRAGLSGAALAALSMLPRGAAALADAPNARDLDRFVAGAPKDLMMDALSAAKGAGASYADVRIARFRQNFVVTREHQIVNVVDTDTLGCGVRALVDGCWGFAATRTLTSDAVATAAREAVAIAKANRVARDRPVELVAAPAFPNATWKSAYETDPFEVPLEAKVDLLLKANAEALSGREG